MDLYGSLVEKLSKYGEVLTPFVADKSITNLGSEHEGGDRAIHDRDVELLRQCSVVVAEVTQPSLGVGYEIGRAVAMGCAQLGSGSAVVGGKRLGVCWRR